MTGNKIKWIGVIGLLLFSVYSQVQVAQLSRQLEDVRSALDDAQSEADALNRAVDDLMSAIDAFGYEDWRIVVPQAYSAAADVESAASDVESAISNAVRSAMVRP